MKFIKHKAFTLAEVMILLLTLSVLMAAFAPVMTKRQHNVSYDDVWTYVPSDNHNDAYFDAANKSFTSQAFIGIPVKKALDVSSAVQDGASNTLYSKLVIRSAATNKLKGISDPQSQMQFRYGNSDSGTYLGSLLAGNNNFLLGGEYKNVQDTAKGNTAYGASALSKLTTGSNNTAVGYLAFNELKVGSNNTAIGSRAGRYTTGKRNTFAGSAAGAYITNGNDNTMVGNMGAPHISGSMGYANTILGALSSYKEGDKSYKYQLTSGYGNTAVGSSSLISNISGYYNTAVGTKSLRNLTSGYYNTAIGYNTGDLLETGSNKTFVGAFSGTKQSTDTVKDKSPLPELYENTHERVFIGAIPRTSKAKDKKGPGAVLEVHNVTGTDSSKKMTPIPGIGYESVVVNGNLVVRGQSYLEIPIWRPATNDDSTYQTHPEYLPKGLVAHVINRVNNNTYAFMGYDGARRNETSFARCNRRRCQSHDYKDLRTNCICTTVGSYTGNTNYANVGKSLRGSSTSYDWITKTESDITVGDDGDGNGTICGNRHRMGNYYDDQAVGGRVYIERNSEWKKPNRAYGNNVKYNIFDRGDHRSLGTDQPLAHLKGVGMPVDGRFGSVKSSCCPNLTTKSASDQDNRGISTSDARLKNIGDKFTAGLAELKRINIYNFTFKNDVRNLPQVGVMAQDLKLVFPNAVSKDENGYYQIRWDDMFYAVINSVKELNTRIEKLASKITTDKARVAALKKDNQELNDKLDELEAELTIIEAKKH